MFILCTAKRLCRSAGRFLPKLGGIFGCRLFFSAGTSTSAISARSVCGLQWVMLLLLAVCCAHSSPTPRSTLPVLNTTGLQEETSPAQTIHCPELDDQAGKS